MQDKREGREFRDPFDMLNNFENSRGFGGSLTGRSPFDDPFFTRPFGTMFDQRNPVKDSTPTIPQKGPVIQELTSDDDEWGEEREREDGTQKDVMPGNEPFIDHPDDETDGKTEHTNFRKDHNRAEGKRAQTYKVNSCKVTYGGIDGAYYTSSSTKRMGSDGVVMEECKEADKTTGRATHRISRGLQDKGHSVTRKLNSDGKVETLQKLHNMVEDELGSFEEAWKDNTGMHLPTWTGSGANNSGANSMASLEGRFLLPSIGNMEDPLRRGPSSQSNAADASSGRARKVVRIPID